MKICVRCESVVSAKMIECAHCGLLNPRGAFKRFAAAVTAIASGISLSTTLSACYGAPCASAHCGQGGDIPTCDQITATPDVDDVDGDGFCLDFDCDEEDATINSAAFDTPDDGIDQDCSGEDATRN